MDRGFSERRGGGCMSAPFCRGPLPEPPRLTKLGRGGQGEDFLAPGRIGVAPSLARCLAPAPRAPPPRALRAPFLAPAPPPPAALSHHAVAHSFDAAVAAREIDAALAADDPDLAMSFLALARERNFPIEPALADRVERANARLATATRSLGNFAGGLVVGEAEDISGL